MEELKRKNAAAKKKGVKKEDVKAAPAASTSEPPESPSKEPSLAEKSKMRSASFRHSSATTAQPPTSPSASPRSPDGDTAPDIYRKHVARIEELEKENKRLSKEAAEAKRRWEKAEEELAARDDGSSSAGDSDEEKVTMAKLVSYTSKRRPKKIRRPGKAPNC